MRRSLPVLLALALTVPASAQFTPKQKEAAKKDPGTYTIDEASIAIEKIGPAVKMTEITPPSTGPGDDLVLIDQIINLGQKIWAIIEKNKPVVEVKNSYATALPKGITNWGELEGWSQPKGTVYTLTANNAYGTRVINVRFQVLRTYGGSYNGKGKFLTAVTVEPLLVEVLWGYQFNLTAEVPDTSVINVGTSADPVAAMMPTLKWQIKTVLKDSQGKSLFYLQGDGLYKEVGGPFRRDFQNNVAKALARAPAL